MIKDDCAYCIVIIWNDDCAVINTYIQPNTLLYATQHGQSSTYFKATVLCCVYL